MMSARNVRGPSKARQQSREDQFFMSTEAPEDIQVVRTADEFIYDNHGKRYIDFNAGWCVGNPVGKEGKYNRR